MQHIMSFILIFYYQIFHSSPAVEMPCDKGRGLAYLQNKSFITCSEIDQLQQ